MKITFFGVDKKDQPAFLQSLGGEDVSFFEERLDEKNVHLAKDADIISIFVNSMANEAVIDALPNLKFIAARSTGFDQIDVEYAKMKGIKVSNVSGYGSHTVAEFTFGLILSLSRNISSANNHIRESSDFNYTPAMEGFDLQGKTLGVIGTGNIGKNVVKVAKGFQMSVLAYDLYPNAVFAKENNFEYKSFAEVVSQSDIITLHAPYTKENHHLINKENISTMKKGVYIINTARGELIDTGALSWGLNEGIVAGAGLDVLESERNLKDQKNFLGSSQPNEESIKVMSLNHELMKMGNVIVTPHIAFNTHEAVAEIGKITVQNIKSFISGTPINLVN